MLPNLRTFRAASAALVLLAGACAPAAPVLAPTSAPAPRPSMAAPERATVGYDLSVRNIMRGEGLVGRSPTEVRWSDDARWVYFRWRDPEAADTATSIYRVPAEGGAPQALPDTLARRIAPAADGRWTPDRRFRAFVREGDVYVADAAAGTERRITDTPARERGAHLSPDGRTVYYLSGNDVFALDLAGGPLRQLTDLRTENAPPRPAQSEQRTFLRDAERELLDVVRERAAEREHRERQDSLRTALRPLYLGRDATVASAQVSPSGRYLLLAVNDRAAGAAQTMVPNFVTESGYTEPLNARPKVGDVQAAGRVAIVELATGEARWVRPLGDSARIQWQAPGWAPHTDRALLTAIPHDFKSRHIYTADAQGRTTLIETLRDTAWVGGPAFFSVGWIDDARVYFVSERTGWSHLYTAPAAGGRTFAVTAGAWEVTGVELSPDGRTFYLTTGETHPGERNVYAVPAEGGARTRLTAMDGWTTGALSPDGRRLALLHSTADAPPELYLADALPGAAAVRVTHSTRAEFRAGPWIRPEVVAFRARDGQTVYARIYRPRELGAQPHGGAVLFVHGAGYLQNAHRGWSTYYREYMFHHLLASRGYTVLDVDYRGSAGYGAAWRTGIYRHMGGADLTDHVDAVGWLVANEGVDPERVGIYGGSYGGFITLMALFTEPDVFRSGAALRSVTDWAHYNHPYTRRILNQPQDDPRRTSAPRPSTSPKGCAATC
jgi:dipeptidyl aminopeptidase/acylaminoacyl peptidase